MNFYRPPALQGALDALGSVNRALRAWKFYPQGHPVRKSSIKQAHIAMLRLLDGNNLSLNSGRKEFSFPDGEVLKDSTNMSSSLSYELFIRRVRKITFLNDLYQEDLLDFLRLLTITPDVAHKAGGLDKLMVDHGIRTIWVNEFDLSIIHKMRREVEATKPPPQGLDEVEECPRSEDIVEFQEMVEFVDELNPGYQLQLLLEKLTAAVDKDGYLQTVRHAIACSDSLKARNELIAIFPLVELLADHVNDPERLESLQECARFGLEQLAMHDEFLAFLIDHIGHADGLSQVANLAILMAAGPVGVDLTVKKMGATDSLSVRKALITLLVGIGEPALPAILKMMADTRWYTVRNLATVLGDIGSSEALPELQKCLQHPDIRVCKEAIRSLAKIGGRNAEAAIVDLLRGNDPSLFPQVIASLGGMKSRKAVTELMRIISRDDLFLKHLSLKIDALGAIAMIADRQVVPILTDMLACKHIVVPNRWKQLKIAIAGCLARLGDTRALPVLKNKAASSGELGRACAEAAETIERTGGK